MIDSFHGSEHGFLSNFSPSPIWPDWWPRTLPPFPTVEHAFQASKQQLVFDHPSDWLKNVESIRSVATPGQAKRLGRHVILKPDWDDIKVEVMRDLLERKFSDPRLDALLTCTQPHVLVEGNTWGDRFWGACWSAAVRPLQLDPDFNWAEDVRGTLAGQNWLGKLLMEIRDRERG